MADPTAIADIISRHLDGQLSPEDKEILEVFLRESESNRQYYWSYARQHAIIAHVLQEDAGRQASHKSDALTIAHPATQKVRRRSGTVIRRRQTAKSAIPFPVKVAMAFAALLVAAIGINFIGLPTNTQTPTLALVSHANGDVRILRAGNHLPCTVGMSLIADDNLVVAAESGMQFTYENESTTLALRANSEIRLTSANQAKHLHLTLGSVEASVAKQPFPMRVSTPHGEAIIVGTHFVLTAEPTKTTLTVTEGKVRLANLAGTVDVNSGSSANIVGTAKPMLLPEAPASSQPNGDLMRDIAGHWPLDEQSGRNVRDLSPFNGSGTTISEKPIWRIGHIEGALHFNGNDDGVRIQSSDALHLSKAFSICAWIKPDTFGEHDFGRILAKGTGNDHEYDLGLNGVWKQVIFTSAQGEFHSAPHSIRLGSWQHVAITFSEDTLTFYIDGNSNNVAKTSGRPTTGASPLYLGRDVNGQRAFAGDLDDIRIYQRCLSANEISELASGALP